MNKTGICVAGSIIVDNISKIKQYPNKGELSQIIGLSNSVGGVPPNVGIDLKRIDPKLEVYAYGKVSNDSNGNFVLKVMKENGVNIDGVKLSKTPTSFTNVMSEVNGERTFLTYPGASAEFGFDDIKFDKFKPKMLHLGYFLLSKKLDDGDGLKILKAASKEGILTSIDIVTDSDIKRYKLVKPCLKYVNNLIINEIEASRITSIPYNEENAKKIMEELIKLGVKDRVIIHEPKNAYCLSKNGFTHIKSLSIPKEIIKGTPGAGDAFCAACLYYIYKDKSDEEILKFATSSAALSLTSIDGTGAMKNEKAIIKFAKQFKRLK